MQHLIKYPWKKFKCIIISYGSIVKPNASDFENQLSEGRYTLTKETVNEFP